MKINFDDLKDKVCVVTGGTGVLGSAMVKTLGHAGIKTVILSRRKETADSIAIMIKKETGTESLGMEADVLDKNSLIEVKKTINEKFGDIHFLINGAGGNSPGATTKVEKMEKEHVNQLEQTFFGLDVDGFDEVFDLNFKGTLLPSLVFTTDMVKNQKGVVINISSMNSFRPLTKIPAYSAAKSSINNFTQWLSVHLAKTGVRVNAIAPGFFLTKQNSFLLVDQETGKPTPRGQKIINNTPMERYGEPEDLNGILLFLLSDISKFITGVIIPVDGGYSAFGGV